MRRLILEVFNTVEPIGSYTLLVRHGEIRFILHLYGNTGWTQKNFTLSKWYRNNCGVLRNSHLHQLIENTQSFVSYYPGDCCCCAPPLDATSFENGYATTEELVCSAVSEERVCFGCATCISHTISHGTTEPSIHLRLVQEIRAERVYLQKQESWSALCVWCSCGPCSGLLPMQPTKINRPKNPAWAFTYEPVQTSIGPGSETRRFGRTGWIIVSTSTVWLAEHISSLCKVCTKICEFFYRLM
jgi:hypothetical protein